MSSAMALRCFQRFPQLVRTLSLSSSSESSVPSPKPDTSGQSTYFKTLETNPINHTVEHIGLYYTLPESEAQIFHHGGLPRPFMQQCTTFNETNLMIRKPSVEIIQYLAAADYKNPPMKFVLYGKPGNGKSLIMAHVLHYASASKWVLVHVPWVGNWLRSPKEIVNSSTRPGFVDLPENAVKWLQHFKTQNQAVINELDLRLANDYEWSKRETSKVGDPLLDIVELGLNRSRHASEIIIALIREIKNHCISDKCKALVAVDGFSAFFHPETRVRNEEKMVMPPEKVSFIPAFLDATKADWHNAAVVVTCDELAVPGHDASPFPLYQLGVHGFHHLDPFVPIYIPEMTEAEVRNMLAYYRERRWLHLEGVDDQLVFLCGGSPYKLMNICNPL